MRPLGLNDTIFYNLGDAYISSVAVLDGPCDLPVLLAEFEGVLDAMPALSERPVRLGFWTFAKYAGPIDLAAHVAVIRDPSIRAVEDVVPRLDRLRQTSIKFGDRPPWRIFVLNPEEPGDDTPMEERPISALYLQLRHGLADAMRGLQILGRMSGYEPTAAHAALARRVPEIDILSLEISIKVHDVGLLPLRLPRRAMSHEGDASARLTAVAAAAVADPELFPNAQPLRGNVGRTKLIRRRGPASGVGNHMKMVTVKTTAAPEKKRRFRIPFLSRAQDLPISQWLVALAPRRLARFAMRVWYSSFDALATLVPLPRRLLLGRRAVTAVFGAPPLWGPVPLVMIALAGADDYNITVLPGTGFGGDVDVLLERLQALLLPGTGRLEATLEEPAETEKDDEPAHAVFAKGR